MPGLLSAMEGFCVIGIVIATGYVAARMRIGGPTAQMVLNRYDEKPDGLESVASGDKVTVKYTGTISEVDPFEGKIISVEKAE